MHSLKICAVSLATLFIGGFGATASAAESSGDFDDMSSLMLEEIVVTARRREESAQTVPVAVTPYTADDIANRGAVVISDLARETPSLTIRARTSDRNTQIISLRGQVQTDAVATLDPSVGTYLNDIYVARSSGANFELFDVDRVEVLAGPQGTLYGRNTTGGAVKLITTQADPKGKLGGYAAVTGGSYNARRFEGAMNMPFNDKFAVRLAGVDATRDGYGKTRVGTLGASAADPGGFGFDGSAPFTVQKTYDTDDKNTRAGRVSALFLPTDKLSFAFVGDYGNQKTNGATGYNLGQTLLTVPPASTSLGPIVQPFGNFSRCSDDFYTTCDNFSPKADAETMGAALTTAYDTSVGTAKLIYGYRDMEAVYKTDLEGSPLAYESITLPSMTKQHTVEAQLQGQAAALDYTVGVYYFKETGEELFTDDSLGGLSKRFIGADVDNESRSLYGQTGYAVTKTVRLTTGLRYTEDDKGIVGNAFALPSLLGGPTGLCLYGDSPDGVSPAPLTPSPTKENCRSAREDTFSHLSWTVGLDWQPRDGVLAYVKSSEGYRAGGQNVRGFTTDSLKPFKEESVRDVEVGLKSLLADRVRFNLTYFRSNYSDIQTTQFLELPFPQNTTTVVANEGKAVIDGVELQSTFIASDNLSFDVTGSSNSYNYSLDSFASVLTPKYKGSVSANMFLPVSYGDWSARLSYAYQSRLMSTTAGTDSNTVPSSALVGRGLLDARLAVNLREYDTSVSLFASNLMNKKYFEFLQTYVVRDPANPGSNFIAFNRLQVGEPRMIGLEVRKRF
jgi:iron complex outermembrane receptor protein